MKTLHILITAMVIVVLAATNTNAHNVTNLNQDAAKNLRSSIKKMVSRDFIAYNNFLDQHNIDEITESVVVMFTVDEKNKIKMKKADCDNCLVAEYVEQLLDGKKIREVDLPTNVTFKVNLKLYYRS